MEHYYISKLEMILGGQLRGKESENYKSTNDIDILESLLRQSPENLKFKLVHSHTFLLEFLKTGVIRLQEPGDCNQGN